MSLQAKLQASSPPGMTPQGVSINEAYMLGEDLVGNSHQSSTAPCHDCSNPTMMD
jgi:hypothetical protein